MTKLMGQPEAQWQAQTEELAVEPWPKLKGYLL